MHMVARTSGGPVQARGLPPTRKYEAQAGRDVIDMTRPLRQHVTGGHAEHDVDYFIDALAFNWLVVGTDAHARNYSLLHSRTATRLAPLYDLNSYLPYRGDRSVSLSMRIGFSERDPDAIGRYRGRHVLLGRHRSRRARRGVREIRRCRARRLRIGCHW